MKKFLILLLIVCMLTAASLACVGGGGGGTPTPDATLTVEVYQITRDYGATQYWGQIDVLDGTPLSP